MPPEALPEPWKTTDLSVLEWPSNRCQPLLCILLKKHLKTFFKKKSDSKALYRKRKKRPFFNVLDFLNCHSLKSHLAETCSPSVGAFSNMDAFSNTPQYFYHTSVSSAIAIKLLNWCLSGASPEQETVL